MITLILKHRFIVGPVLLSSVTKHFAGFEHIFRFYDLVKDYMPEERENLMKLAPTDAAREFIKLFSKRYFDIKVRDTWGQEWQDGAFIERSMLSELVRRIPIEWHGLNQWDYEAFNGMPRSQLVAETICQCPFESMSRVAVQAQFLKVAGDDKGLLKLLPKKGYRIEDIEVALSDGEFPGLLARCQWLFSRTGNQWLDHSHRSVEWSRENVDDLTRDWKTYIEIDKQMKDFDSWLKDHMPARSAQVIKYLAQRIGKPLVEILGGEDDNEARQERSALTV